VSSFLFSVILLCRPAYASTRIGFESYQFSSLEIYQGASNVYVDLQIANDSNSSLIVHGAFVHFDWQALNESFMAGSQRSGEPYDLGKDLDPAEDYVIRMSFSVPLSVSEGGHAFYFKVFYDNGLEDQWNPRAEDPYAELSIYSWYERLYFDHLDEAEEKVVQAQRAGFISPEARSLLQHAEDNLNAAYSYADEGDWKSAASHVISSSSRVDEAYEAEQRFHMYLIIGAVIGVGAVIGGVLLVRRRKRSTKTTTESS